MKWVNFKPHKDNDVSVYIMSNYLPAVKVTCDPSVEVALLAGGCCSETWYTLPSGTDSDVSTKRNGIAFLLTLN